MNSAKNFTSRDVSSPVGALLGFTFQHEPLVFFSDFRPIVERFLGKRLYVVSYPVLFGLIPQLFFEISYDIVDSRAYRRREIDLRIALRIEPAGHLP